LAARQRRAPPSKFSHVSLCLPHDKTLAVLSPRLLCAHFDIICAASLSAMFTRRLMPLIAAAVFCALP
jgi:hypothetical protein